MRVAASALRSFLEQLLVAAGCTDAIARLAADVFVEADLRGHAIQGIDHVYTALDGLLTGRIDGAAEPRIVRRREVTVQVDGCRGHGQPAAILAVDEAATLARRAGSGAAALVNADDVYMLGYYVERLARAGLLGLAMICTWPPRVRHPDGLDPLVGTNPVAIAIPLAGRDPIVCDFTASSVAIGKVGMAAYHCGELLPDGIAFDIGGAPTRRPEAAMAGSLAPVSGLSGFALLLAAALIGGALAGGSVGQALSQDMKEATFGRPGRGNLFLALDPQAFAGTGGFKEGTRALLDALRDEAYCHRYRMPGAGSFERRAAALHAGVTVAMASWERARAYAARLGVRVPTRRAGRHDDCSACQKTPTRAQY